MTGNQKTVVALFAASLLLVAIPVVLLADLFWKRRK